jgi:hypothetical protein
VFVVRFQNLRQVQLVNFQNQTLPENRQPLVWGKFSSRIHLKMDFPALCWKAFLTCCTFSSVMRRQPDFPSYRCTLWLHTAYTSRKSTFVGAGLFGNVYETPLRTCNRNHHILNKNAFSCVDIIFATLEPLTNGKRITIPGGIRKKLGQVSFMPVYVAPLWNEYRIVSIWKCLFHFEWHCICI